MNERKRLVENYEAVEGFWNEVNKRKDLPNTAVLNLPTVLSRSMQTQLAMLDYDEAISALKNAIEDVDKGSVKKLGKLVKEEISRIKRENNQ